MSIRSMVTGYLDKLVDARFRRDSQGRLLFMPWGFGRGRIVSDAATEQRLRQAYRRLMIGILFLAVPVIAIFSGPYKLSGPMFLVFIVACTLLGFLAQLYPARLARHLPLSDERVSYVGATMYGLDRFGTKFLVFGLVISLLFTLTSVLVLIFGGGERLTMLLCLLVFLPMVAVYAVALQRRWRARTA